MLHNSPMSGPQLAVLQTRDDALAERSHRLRELSGQAHGERWSSLVTAELIGRAERERAWIAYLRSVAEVPSSESQGRAEGRGTAAEADSGRSPASAERPPSAPRSSAAAETAQEPRSPSMTQPLCRTLTRRPEALGHRRPPQMGGFRGYRGPARRAAQSGRGVRPPRRSPAASGRPGGTASGLTRRSRTRTRGSGRRIRVLR